MIAAGLKRVVYLEPYPKSIAKQLYPKSIQVDNDMETDPNAVRFEPFVGVAPRRFFELFDKVVRKDAAGYALPDPTLITPPSALATLDPGRTDYCVLATNGLADLHFGAAVDGYQQVARFCFLDGARTDNITDWALEQFQQHYGASHPAITKDAIFHYVYAALYDPIYREKYGLNLKREFPRVPFHSDFWRWAGWGEELMTLHTGYEGVEPWPLVRVDTPDQATRQAGISPKALLRANKEIGSIQVDSETQLTGIPAEAWTYRLGNRSALEWILDQYKEKTPKDPTIREKFNTYRFADHKERVIELLARVTRASVETMRIVRAMETASKLS